MIQGGLQVANAFFLSPVVAREVGRIVQGQHAKAGHDGIHRLIVEGRTIVAFEEQRWTILPEQAFQVGGDLMAIEPVSDQWLEPITGAQVLYRNDLAASTILRSVAGPGQTRLEPMNVFHVVKLIPPIIPYQLAQLPTRQGIRELFIEFARALAAYAAMIQLPEQRIKLCPVQRH